MGCKRRALIVRAASDRDGRGRRSAWLGLALTATVALMLTGCGPAEVLPPEEETASVKIVPVQVDSFMLLENATVESDSGGQVTTLTVNVTKLDNSVGRSLGITIDFGNVRCDSRRIYLVYAAHGRGGNLYEGDAGLHFLTCKPFTLASAFEELPAGVVR